MGKLKYGECPEWRPATDRRNFQSTATEVPAARRKPIFAYFLAA
jgi:hypothetical protein